MLMVVFTADAAPHRATRLGHPATRFAPPLRSAEDLRARFRDPKLKPDIASILNQWGWKGNLEDIHRAALNEEIKPLELPTGTIMPFMSSRKNGKPITLREVLWAGKEPIQAFSFRFVSNGRRYHCITPRPCSNFFVVDEGPANTTLTIECHAPDRSFTGRQVKVCLTARNAGPANEPDPTIVMVLPEHAEVVATSDGGTVSGNRITWKLDELKPGEGKEVCVGLKTSSPGNLAFKSTVSGKRSETTDCSCETDIIGVYSLLVEVIDLDDPIQIGQDITYVITAKNQGDQSHSNVRVAIELPANQQYVRSTGASHVGADGGRSLKSDPFPNLPGKQTAEWRVTTRALPTANVNGLVDSRFVVNFSSDQITDPIREEEATQIY
ncbi:MAG: putative repeat protein (TIGR01451 family) [Limisphaerales bacterium]|jgi:uncharacterized repeat protein (TIGR01451 family)